MNIYVTLFFLQIFNQHNAGARSWQPAVFKMAELDADLVHIVPSSILPPFWAKLVVGLVSSSVLHGAMMEILSLMTLKLLLTIRFVS
jgi:hypothetical protein